MGKITTNFKTELEKAFSGLDARRDKEGNAAFNDFNKIQAEQEKDEDKEKTEQTGSASAGEYVSKMEAKEATDSGSSGAYETPSMWAKSTSKKHWRGRAKTQIPGGKFVTIKKKCKTFPYCNQGDIKALNIYENAVVKDVINRITKTHGISENVIKAIIQYELEKANNKLVL